MWMVGRCGFVLLCLVMWLLICAVQNIIYDLLCLVEMDVLSVLCCALSTVLCYTVAAAMWLMAELLLLC
jgi:hypothetical protein